MAAPHEHTPSWLSVVKRLIPRWQYPYLRVFAGTHLVGGLFVLGLGTLLLAYGSYGWAALLLALAALLFSFGYLDLMVAHSLPPRP